jgi:hypothetical protein
MNIIPNPQNIIGIISIICFAMGGGNIWIHTNCCDHHQTKKPAMIIITPIKSSRILDFFSSIESPKIIVRKKGIE